MEARSETYERGWKTLLELNRGRDPQVVEHVASLSPEIARMIVEFGYGECYAREGLLPQQRQLLTIGMLTALGDTRPQLEVHVSFALNAGVAPSEIIETMLHAIPFCGFPRVLNALEAVRTVFDRRGLSSLREDTSEG